MEIFFSPEYSAELKYESGAEHPMRPQKFSMAHKAMIDTGIPFKTITPHPATRDDFKKVHSAEYVDAFYNEYVDKTNSDENARKLAASNSLFLDRLSEEDRLKFVKSVEYTCGGFTAAAKSAMLNRVSGSLSSSSHHAERNRGGPFCTFNALALAAQNLLDEGKTKRILIADCDAHYGNGTADIFQDNDNVFTYSICGSIIGKIVENDHSICRHLKFERGHGEPYLEQLIQDLELLRSFKPDAILYNAAGDPYVRDTCGQLGLTKNDLQSRDRNVFEFAKKLGVPIAFLLGGGYPNNLEDIVSIYKNTFVTAHEVFEK